MSKPPPARPEATPSVLAARAARQRREAAALRANLRKRKDQAQARDSACPGKSADPLNSGDTDSKQTTEISDPGSIGGRILGFADGFPPSRE